MSDFDKYIDALVRNERPDDTYPKNESSWEELFEFGRRRIFEIVVLKRELTELRAERDAWKVSSELYEAQGETHYKMLLEKCDDLELLVEAARIAIDTYDFTVLAAALARVDGEKGQ